MQFTKGKKAVVALGAAAVAVGAAGTAYAYWSTSGNGSDQGTAASSNGAVVYHAAFTATSLSPGTSVPVTYSATNAGASDLAISNPVATVTSDKGAACTAYLGLSGQPTQGTTVVPHGGSPVALGSATITFANDTAASQDACKGQVVTVSIASS